MLIIANPASRSGRGRKLWRLWQKALTANGVAYDWQMSASAAHCRSLAQCARNTVVAVGGDGAINNVLNGVMRSPHNCAMGVLYAGTSPDFCRFHHIPPHPQATLQTLLDGHIQKVDLAEVTYTAIGETRFFASSCNVGLGAATAAFANKYRKYLGDALGTGLGMLKAMLTHKQFTATLVLDEETFIFSKINHIIILKNPHIASGLKINAELEPADGRLLAIVMHGHSRLGLVGLVKALYNGALLQKPGVFARFCRNVSLTAAPAQKVEFDGDPNGITPITVSLKPQALNLICGGPHA